VKVTALTNDQIKELVERFDPVVGKAV